MHPRRASRAYRLHRRCVPLVCVVLALNSTPPHAQSSLAGVPLALKLALELAREVDVYAHAGEALPLTLSLALSEPIDPVPAAPLPLRLAILRSEPSAGALERKAPALDFGTAQPVFYAIRLNRQDHGVARLLRLP